MISPESIPIFQLAKPISKNIFYYGHYVPLDKSIYDMFLPQIEFLCGPTSRLC